MGAGTCQPPLSVSLVWVGYEMVIALFAVNLPTKSAVPDLPAAGIVTAILLQSTSAMPGLACLTVTHDLMICGPSTLITAPVTLFLMVQTGLPTRTRSSEVFTPLTEVAVVSLSERKPGHETITDSPVLLVHVVLAAVLPEKVTLPDAAAPSELVVSVSSAVGQPSLVPPSVASRVKVVLVELNEILVFTGVSLACAGVAATAHAASAATASSSPRVVALFKGVPFSLRGARRAGGAKGARREGFAGGVVRVLLCLGGRA